MDINILIFVSCICMLFIIGKILIVPIKWILKLVFNSILGGVLIWIINLVVGIWGLHIGLNIYTSILVRNTGNSRSNFFGNYEIVFNIKNFPLVIASGKIILHISIKITISKIVSFKFFSSFNNFNNIINF